MPEYEVTMLKFMKEKYELYQEEQEKITKFHIWEEMGWAGCRALMDSMKAVQYPHCSTIRFWKTYVEDEGVRAICQFLEIQKSKVEILELLDNKITKLGCEFLSRVLHPTMAPTILILKLDHNQFGSEGINHLSKSLAINPILKSLSLSYCAIDHEAAQALFEILIYTRSALEEINLTGNLLRNKGVTRVFMGASIAKSLKKILVADNQFNDTADVVKALEFCMVKNKNLTKYDLKYNNINQNTIQKVTTTLMEGATHVQQLEVPPRIENKEIFDNFEKALDANRKAGKKGKKGKGKGKKKK